MSKQSRSRTPAQKLQHEHYHRLGSLTFMMGLISWHLQHNRDIPRQVRRRMELARQQLYVAVEAEVGNNEFINFNHMVK